VLSRVGLRHTDAALDLGCGTGLMGVLLRPIAAQLVGYDLSAAMLSEAQEKGCYDRLDKCDITELALIGPSYDLIVAADVFNYIGALEQVIGWCADALLPEGRLCFTVEAGDAPVRLMASRRFTHSRNYITDLLAQAGFAPPKITEAPIRQDRGEDVMGLIVFSTPAHRHAPLRDDDRNKVMA